MRSYGTKLVSAVQGLDHHGYLGHMEGMGDRQDRWEGGGGGMGGDEQRRVGDWYGRLPGSGHRQVKTLTTSTGNTPQVRRGEQIWSRCEGGYRRKGRREESRLLGACG